MSKIKTLEVEATDVKTISTEQLEALQGHVTKQNQIQMQIGGLEGHKSNLLDQLKAVVAELTATQTELEAEYGPVNIDLTTGEISDVSAAN
jgi:23S rRNA pseudoU1915 N3-methylase RlmH